MLCIPVASDSLACALFTYNGNVVAIDLLGAGIPLLFCLLSSAYLLINGRFRLKPRRFATLAALTASFGLVVAGEYALWDSIYGGLGVNTRLLIFTVLIPAGVLAFLLLDRARVPNLSILQIYIVGTVGTTLSDFFRIFSGALNISPVIIGANRLSDGVFLDGLLLILTYLFTAVLYDTLTRPGRPQDREAIAGQNPESNSGMVPL